MFVGLIIACLVLGVSGDTHIVGGKIATAIYPYQVSLRYKNTHFCGGAIITKRFILTAAHCLIYPSSNTSVAVGSNNLFKNVTFYPAEAFFAHKKYNNQTHLNDIGLIRVSKDIQFNKFVKSINLPNSDSNYENKSLVATGWGLLWHNGFIPEDLQEITLKGYSQEKCAAFYKKNENLLIKETQICTSMPEGQGMCNGDSGGPLVDNNTNILVGLVSIGIPCAKGYPDVFTRVFHFKEWIAEMMEKNNASGISQLSIILYCLMYLCIHLYKIVH